MKSRRVRRRVRSALAGAAAGLLTLAVLVAASTAVAADPALTEKDVEMVIPVTVFADNPCTGEPVVLQGHLFLQFHITLNATHLTIIESANMQGVTAVNPITGVKHVTSDILDFTLTLQKSASATSRQSWLFTRSGESVSEDDFYLRLVTHFSTNAAGDVTADIENYSMECR